MKQDVMRIVRRRAAANRIQYCYMAALPAKPDIKGKLTVKWTINLTGKVHGVQIVGNTLKDEKVERCIRKVIGRMRFKEPKVGICIVKLPFLFSTTSEDSD